MDYFSNEYGGKGGYDEGPPDTVVEMGAFQHSCEGDMVIKSTNEKVRSAPGPKKNRGVASPLPVA